MRLLCPAGSGPVDLLALYEQPPGLRLGMVTSLDGSTAVAGSSRPLSGAADRAVLRALRWCADVVLVGAGTARSEGYRPVRVPPEVQERRGARGQAPVPPVAVVSRGRGLPPGAPLRAPGSGALLLAPAGTPSQDGVEVVAVGQGRVEPALVVEALRERGLVRVLCEGGPALNGTLLAAGLVDEVCATVTPQLAGGQGPRMVTGAPESARALELVSLLEEDGALLGRWRLSPGPG